MKELKKNIKENKGGRLFIKEDSLVYPWEESYETLCRAIDEDATEIEKIVNDPDSCCPARELRRERAAALRYVLGVAENLRHWEW